MKEKNDSLTPKVRRANGLKIKLMQMKDYFHMHVARKNNSDIKFLFRHPNRQQKQLQKNRNKKSQTREYQCQNNRKEWHQMKL